MGRPNTHSHRAKKRGAQKAQRRKKQHEGRRGAASSAPSDPFLPFRIVAPLVTGPSTGDAHRPPRFRLVPLDWQEPPTLEQLVGATDLVGEEETPANGLIWSPEEFRNLSWVQELGPDYEGEADERDLIVERYGDQIPADLAVIDMMARFFGGVVVSNDDWINNEEHVLEFAGVSDLHQALTKMHREGWLTPLTNGILVAPGLFLECIDPQDAPA
ncbi:hypothetical protein [Planomonospora parontospora]|uniref:hypothetical protein n=1 Tax=Planomonospora parontospora TaxID=58119 RepID=UPI0016715AB7|nr:hypothetical protein [Planomonospora parontospora]GGL48377.1 hypothetical protein GCM10014719_57060 [Planomonospora parontospora subsp. antibiotica]GII18751.1 hypothetical protein Ppa05_54770 [Planomonospora parontospora subsp. antibiotica]